MSDTETVDGDPTVGDSYELNAIMGQPDSAIVGAGVGLLLGGGWGAVAGYYIGREVGK